jgi:hypothetical protein
MKTKFKVIVNGRLLETFTTELAAYEYARLVRITRPLANVQII